jgi:antirestriction protein ArdC
MAGIRDATERRNLTMQKRTDAHQIITDRIIAMIEAGAGEFKMPWHRSAKAPLHTPVNCLTKKRYRGINVLSLWASAEEHNYASNEWGTYKQWQEKKTQVRKGEKATLVMFFKEFEVHPDPDDETDNGRRLVARASWAFNAAQVEGYEAPVLPEDRGPIERIAIADTFVRGTGATIRHGGERAFFRPSEDLIQMPDEGLFLGDETRRREAYYSTLLHELTHWSGAEKRLNREFGKRFGDKAYSFEELVAELGAAFLCGSLGITNEPRRDHAQYIGHWLSILKEDKKAISHAAARASAAADYLAELSVQRLKKLAA